MSDRPLTATRKLLHVLTAFTKVAALCAVCHGLAWLSTARADDSKKPPAAANSESYRIGPGDVLEIVPVKMVPMSPFRFEVADEAKISVLGTVPGAPIRGNYPIDTDGTLNLGYSYGKVRLIGMTEVEAAVALREHLLQHLRDPWVTLTLGSAPDRRSVVGKHVVGTDGKLVLGVFGEVDVANLSLVEARAGIEAKLSQSYDTAELWVKLRESNSQHIHVVLSLRGKGSRVTRIKYDGHATVLDAIAALDDFAPIEQVRVTRPGSKPQIMTVAWAEIQSGNTDTNFELQPGDVVTINAIAH
jgi:polysaccharide biosynthesis/export protein